MTESLWLLAAAIAVAGLGAGVLAGLLGVGGGIVLVPVLDFVFERFGVAQDVRMHLAVGTSLATIVPTAVSSALAHHRRGALDAPIARRWSLPVAAGAIIGALLASAVAGGVLAAVFAAVALTMAARMMLETDQAAAIERVPQGPTWLALPGGIGLVSALMGIGGGTLTVPALSAFGVPVHRAVATSAWLGLWIALPAALGYALLGQGAAGLPAGSVGYVNLIAVAALLPTTVLAAPLGARLAHALSRRWLRWAFGAFLLLTGVRMLLRAFGA